MYAVMRPKNLRLSAQTWSSGSGCVTATPLRVRYSYNLPLQILVGPSSFSPTAFIQGRFNFYSRRVQKLSWFEPFDDQGRSQIVDDSITSPCFTAQSGLFPRVRKLNFQIPRMAGLDDVRRMFRFMTPDITTLTFCMNGLTLRPDSMDLGQLEALVWCQHRKEIWFDLHDEPLPLGECSRRGPSSIICASPLPRRIRAGSVATGAAYLHLASCSDLRTLIVGPLRSRRMLSLKGFTD